MATITNQATLSYNGITRLSNITTGELVESLTMTKTAVEDNYQQGNTITYVITLSNTGTTNVTNLTVSDNMGGYPYDTDTVYPLTYLPGSVRYYIGGAPQADPVVNVGPPMTFEGITVPAGGNTTLVYQAAVNNFAPLAAGSNISNTATTIGDETVSANYILPVATAPDLSISKTMSPGIVTENGTITYTFTVQNTGNTEAALADGVVVSDRFLPVLNGVSVLYNGTVWTPGVEYTYDGNTGAFATTAGAVTVPAATYSRNADGSLAVTPGTATVTVTGTV